MWGAHCEIEINVSVLLFATKNILLTVRNIYRLVEELN
ncbi:hypothetical protein GAGA_1073 [Paraglaciecola agarilytica NO2]|uniref:Uncharacterized protein n=1 Tax=Paraglaciecola agarilytica NO2 TaxID=1125747 RepID=A0ABQ0I3N4_9ALTE|nr:hypothetical protein GAGA_1073 [Paraglaciecola agarilytica NO2]